MGDSKARDFFSRIASFFIGIYFIGVALAVPCYNWQYAKTNGFMSWLFLGEVVATFQALGWPYPLVKKLSTARSSVLEEEAPGTSVVDQEVLRSSEEIRELLEWRIEEINREIQRVPFSPNDCPLLESGEACLEFSRVEMRSDLGINRYYRVHLPSVDLDGDEQARESWARLIGPGEFTLGFYEEHEELCKGQTLSMMQEAEFRVGIFYETVGGKMLAEALIDAESCLRFLEISD